MSDVSLGAEQELLTVRRPTRSGWRVPTWMPAAIRWRISWGSQHIRVAVENRLRPLVQLNGVKVKVSRQLSDNIRAALLDGYYESDELNCIESKLAADDRVMEIGAGIGVISTFCALKLGAGRVAAYEANPFMEPLIRSTYALNQVTPELHIAALGDQNGEVEFHVAKDMWESSTERTPDHSTVIKVKRKAINQEIARLDPTFLVMDIEGGEYAIFKQIDFHHIRKMSLELHTDILGPERIAEIRAIIHSAGFRADPKLSFQMPGIKEILFVQR